MNKFPVVLLLAGLACAGCEKKPPKPVVAASDAPADAVPADTTTVESPSGARGPTFTERADVALRNLKTRVAGPEVKDAFTRRRDEWHLDADNLKSELEKNGRIVREKTTATGESVAPTADDAQIVTAVKGKLVADRDIFASKINVGADQGVVSLTGSAGSADLVGRAIQLALDTNGVNRVVSLLTIDAK
ncbi:MAG TPA: BON domain-containing protein [Opitutaceae bacterium]|nr:BON domain-containing protein [Opitutaceae bacterium]